MLFLAARDPRRTHYALHEDEWRFDARRAARARAAARRPLDACSTAASCGELRRFRARRGRASAAGTSRRSGRRSRTRGRAAIPFLVWIESTAARRAHRTRGRSSSRSARSCVRASGCVRARAGVGRRTRARSASRTTGSRSRRTRSTRASSPGASRGGRRDGAASSTSAGSTRRRASTCCSRRSTACRASSSSSAAGSEEAALRGARRRACRVHRPARPRGGRRAVRDARTPSCCRRARSSGGWC